MVNRVYIIVLSGLLLALAIVLPIIFHQFQLYGRIFLPMHLPVLLAGALLGPLSGIMVGLLAPGLSFLLTGMPPPYAVPMMTLELPLYGSIIGLCYYRLKLPLIVSLLLALIAGRMAFAFGYFIAGYFLQLPYPPETWLYASTITGLPGIAIQLIFVPVLFPLLSRLSHRC
ncbi:MAG: ECF transporter S component [candidate division Zixibacteria bacterium]|nr:ECF transporter S component [candidate division Zixibacteria bacterium]